MKTCAFLTLANPADFVIDDELAHKPLARLGWEVTDVPWTQTERAWSDFDAVIIRSPWDYPEQPEAFLAVLEAIDESDARLANPLDIVRWNLSKTYLKSLQEGGVPIVPTLWGNSISSSDFPGFLEQLDSDELVIKPVVGANGVNAFRVGSEESPDRLADIARCHHGRDFMVQPFMPAIITEGEYSVFYFNGEYSHAILKTPAPGEFRSQEERGSSLIAVQPEQQLLERGRQTMEAIGNRGHKTAPTNRGHKTAATGAPLLYARLDFVRDADGDFMVMEAELIEPSLYLRMDPDAPMRFARAVDSWFNAA